MEKSRPDRVAVFATDATGIYPLLTPLTAFLWRNIVHFEVFVYFVGDIPPFVVQKTVETGARVRMISAIPQEFSSKSLAQNIRIFAAQESCFANDTYLLTTDADMWPLSRSYFHQEQDWTKELHLFNAFGMSWNETEYPMCYIGASVSAWREILGEQDFLDSTGIRDQLFVSNLIKRWSGYPYKVQKMARPLDPRFEGFHMRYTDRISKSDWRDLRPGDVDAHLPRDGTASNWKRVRKLLIQLDQHSPWVRCYIDTASRCPVLS